MDAIHVGEVILLALLVGALLPVLVQLHQTMKSAQQLFRSTENSLAPALTEVKNAAALVNRYAMGLGDAKRLGRFVDSMEELAQTIGELRNSVRVASAVGAAVAPAVGAAVHAWKTSNSHHAPAGEEDAGDKEECHE